MYLYWGLIGKLLNSCFFLLASSSGKSGKKGGGGSGGGARVVVSSAAAGANTAERGTGGLNPICHRETPGWQKPITSFFTKAPESNTNCQKLVKDSEKTSSEGDNSDSPCDE